MLQIWLTKSPSIAARYPSFFQPIHGLVQEVILLLFKQPISKKHIAHQWANGCMPSVQLFDFFSSLSCKLVTAHLPLIFSHKAAAPSPLISHLRPCSTRQIFLANKLANGDKPSCMPKVQFSVSRGAKIQVFLGLFIGEDKSHFYWRKAAKLCQNSAKKTVQEGEEKGRRKRRENKK